LGPIDWPIDASQDCTSYAQNVGVRGRIVWSGGTEWIISQGVRKGLTGEIVIVIGAVISRTHTGRNAEGGKDCKVLRISLEIRIRQDIFPPIVAKAQLMNGRIGLQVIDDPG